MCNLRDGRTGAHAYAFRPVSEGDLPLVRNWLCLPHVARWWSDADKQIAELRRTLVDKGFDAHLMLLDDRPVGYLQSYDASSGAEGTDPIWPPGTRGLDLFIGEVWALGQGHGSAFVRHFTRQLLATPGVRQVIADPEARNGRSIRCFERAGFRPDVEVWRPTGPVVLMVCEKTRQA